VLLSGAAKLPPLDVATGTLFGVATDALLQWHNCPLASWPDLQSGDAVFRWPGGWPLPSGHPWLLWGGREGGVCLQAGRSVCGLFVLLRTTTLSPTYRCHMKTTSTSILGMYKSINASRN